jgi:hypothetical protein
MKQITSDSLKVQMIFSCDKKYEMFKTEYSAIWENEGNKITAAFEKITQLKFSEQQIFAHVCEGDSKGENNSGQRIEDPMIFRYSIRNKAGTLLHELGHRLIMEYDLFGKSKNAFHLNDLHQILDLFLFDVIQYAYGKEAALFRVGYEKSFPDIKYEKYWNDSLTLSFKERSDSLHKIIVYCKETKE